MNDLSQQLEPHIPALRRYAWGLLRNREAADDLVQDCLERAIAGWMRRRADTTTRAWLLAILRNTFLNDIRQRRRRGPHIEIGAADAQAGPDVPADRFLMARDALAALATLPGEDRSLLLLIGVEEMTYREAAAIFGVPIGTIMSRLSRARARFRTTVEGGEKAMLRVVK